MHIFKFQLNSIRMKKKFTEEGDGMRTYLMFNYVLLSEVMKFLELFNLRKLEIFMYNESIFKVIPILTRIEHF